MDSAEFTAGRESRRAVCCRPETVCYRPATIEMETEVMKPELKAGFANGFQIGESDTVSGASRLRVGGDELPRERLARYGAAALKDFELLAIILGTGYRGCNVIEVARSVVESHPKEELISMELKQLAQLKGIGRAKASILMAGFELARRGLDKGLGLLPVIANPADTIPMLAEVKDQRKEYFICLYLNARNQVIHKEVVSIGSLSASIVHPREVFQVAVFQSAAAIILAHNHPSGDVSPSKDDIELTRRLVRAGEIIGIDVLDHIIVGPADYLSLKERGVM